MRTRIIRIAVWVIVCAFAALLPVLSSASAGASQIVVSNFMASPPFLTSHGWGEPAWNVPDQVLDQETGCLTKTGVGHLDVSGQFVPASGVSYTLERQKAGSAVWHDLGPVTPNAAGKFRVVWWKPDTGVDCPTFNQTFQVVGSDGSVSNIARLGVFPPLKTTHGAWGTVYHKGQLLQWKAITSTDETTVQVFRHKCPIFNPALGSPSCLSTNKNTFRYLETLQVGRLGGLDFTYRVGCHPFIFKFYFAGTGLHSKQYLEPTLSTPDQQTGC